jgi:hypothetical protein
MVPRFRLPAAGLVLGLMLAPILPGAPALATAMAEPQHIAVTLDMAKLVKLPEHVETIVVGSPIIADVTMLKKNGLVVVTGKGYGQTNVIFLDSSGQAVSEAIVTVQHAQGLLTVQRGTERESYSCAPRCEPAFSLGDSAKFLSDAQSQISSRNSLATPASH